MYSMKVDGELIFAPPVVNDGYIAFDATVTRELNKVDSAEFTIPVTGRGYDRINKLSSVITVWDDDEKIFHGRCIDITEDFYKNRKFNCEGALGYLNDSVLRPYYFNPGTPGNIFKYYVEKHNERVGSSKRFVVGDISTMQNDQIVRDSTMYPSTLDELEDKLIENYGGYVVPRYVGESIYLDYKATSGGTNGQVIQFGKNLLELEQFMDASEVKTIIIPIGATVEGTEERLTIKSVNGGLDYLESSTGIAMFGRIETCEGWDDVTDASNLKAKGQIRLNELIAEATTLNLSAIDLSLLDVQVDKLRLGEYNRVLSVPHNLDGMFQCSRMVLNLGNPQQNQYTFGNPRPTLTDSINRFRLS